MGACGWVSVRSSVSPTGLSATVGSSGSLPVLLGPFTLRLMMSQPATKPIASKPSGMATPSAIFKVRPLPPGSGVSVAVSDAVAAVALLEVTDVANVEPEVIDTIVESDVVRKAGLVVTTLTEGVPVNVASVTWIMVCASPAAMLKEPPPSSQLHLPASKSDQQQYRSFPQAARWPSAPSPAMNDESDTEFLY